MKRIGATPSIRWLPLGAQLADHYRVGCFLLMAALVLGLGWTVPSAHAHGMALSALAGMLPSLLGGMRAWMPLDASQGISASAVRAHMAGTRWCWDGAGWHPPGARALRFDSQRVYLEDGRVYGCALSLAGMRRKLQREHAPRRSMQ
ncbi:hypothetical protein [Oleiagrimonas sp. C23AA]|uniref:hypothetical protein n=1 Tax=Oleiagrimonas sp. C23AA TaxID=2719047 RepID=UPI0014214D0B|nr:hypothetical protein [Oleiagrimonas sp. C23AA]NII10032.1 hypothetical protein [Oleiagrimonas sp. C23AA]